MYSYMFVQTHMYCMHERGKKKKVKGYLLLLQVQQCILYFFVITMGILVLSWLLIDLYSFFHATMIREYQHLGCP